MFVLKETCGYMNQLLGLERTTFEQITGRVSSKGSGIPPEVTSRSRDVNKHGGGANDLPPPLINMQMT